MYALNKLSPRPQTEVGRVGVTTRADNPTEEVIPMDDDRMDGPADVGVDAAQAVDAGNINVNTIPTDGERPWN